MAIPLRPSATSLPLIPSPIGWPHRLLDVAGLQESGWRPTAFREFVLKVHQRCNLACDYCYVYESADQTWRDRPAVMAPEVWRTAARRIAEHADRHRLGRVGIVLHGGEPLLAGVDVLVRLAHDVRAEMPAGCEVTVGMQTNGVLLDEAALERLTAAGVNIGVSVDGSAGDHDKHRRHRNGVGSHSAVDHAVTLLSEPRFRRSFAGLLCTVDPATDPIACYEALLQHAPPSLDLLLPHANWASPPDRRGDLGPTPHGDWLATVFDRWYDAPRQETRIRLFEEIINLVLGGSSRSEQVGLSPVAVAVVESDGSIEQVDSLKSAYAGACHTGLNVRTDSFDAALDHPGIVARQIGRKALCEECLGCPVHQVCGAGHYAHRYRAGDGFRNPSVYCRDLERLIRHVGRRLADDLAALRTKDGQ